MKRLNFQIKILELVPNTRKFEIKENNNKLQIRYIKRGRGGSNSDWIKLPKSILLTPELIAALGIYYAEGNKSTRRWYSSFSNTEQRVVIEGIKLFKTLGINSSHIRAHIKVYNNMPEDSLIRHWSKVTNIPEDNFIKTHRATAKLIYARNRRKPLKYGLIEVYYASVVIRDLIDNLLNKVKLLSLKNSKIRRAFLKGMFSGEGTIKLNKNKLQEIRIASCDKNEQEFIRKLLLKENIRPSNAKYKFYVGICGSENFSKINNSGIIDLHPEKKMLFDTGYKNTLLSSGE